MTMASLSPDFSVNVVGNNNWSCLFLQPKFIKECHRQLPYGAANSTRCIARLSTMPLRLSANNGHIITLQIWMPWKYQLWVATQEGFFWNLHPKPKTVSALKVALEKIWDSFPQLQLIRLSRVLQVAWKEYVNGDGRYSKHFSLLKECLHLRCLGCLEHLRQFLITSQLLSCHD